MVHFDHEDYARRNDIPEEYMNGITIQVAKDGSDARILIPSTDGTRDFSEVIMKKDVLNDFIGALQIAETKLK